MYPNPQDAFPLPPSPDSAQYARIAKELARACRSGESAAYHVWSDRFVRRLLALQDGAAPTERAVARHIAQLENFARDRMERAQCALTQAQHVIARAHGFASWPALREQIDRLMHGDDPFERAADAIVSGDVHVLSDLLSADARLVRARSRREHRATLLHYVSANGVENYRQRTPQNIVAITRQLLDAGADIHAQADVYGGAATLGLVVTSAHPRAAGVQLQLAELLLERGARVHAGIVRSCLANGCPEAAELMAQHADVEIDEAAGLGLTDAALTLYAGSPPEQRVAALIMACWYDRVATVEALLEAGLDPASLSAKDGCTALHIASYVGSARLARLLLDRGAPVDVRDTAYRTTPLVWALHAWLVDERADGDYRTVVLLLVEAGAEVRREWIDDARVRDDAELWARLRERVRD